MSNALRVLKRNLVLGAAMSVLIPVAALARDAAPSDKDSQAVAEVVVTGTSLRKVAAPAGAEAFALDPAAITATGALSTDQLLTTIPQLNGFNSVPKGGNGATQITVNQIDLRGLPQGTGGSSPTLVMMDGHRIVGSGGNQDYPDPDVIPPALIQRVEIVTDGGSAIYGSDAVGGVINFITKKNFDGVEAGVRQGFGDHYKSTDVDLTVGKAWSSGDVFVGYNYARHDALYGSSRSYVRDINYTTGLPSNNTCSPANAQINGTNYAVVGGNSLSLGNANLCDLSRTKAFIPQQDVNSVMAGFRQELTSNLEFDVKGYYSERDVVYDGGPLVAPSVQVNAGNPNYIASGGGQTETAFFNFGPVGEHQVDSTKLWSFGITPTVTWKMPGDWEMRGFFNYGRSETLVNSQQLNNALVQPAVNAGTINPFNVAASSPAALASAFNFENYGIGKETLTNAKVTFDGPVPLVRLPGGEIRLAIGGEYLHEAFRGTSLINTYQKVRLAPLNTASRVVESAFAELNFPVIGPDNNIPFVNSFSIGAAERFDNYSDFGNNWAPNLGVTWKPVDWISLRGRWNKAFQAPSLVQISQAKTPSVTFYPASIIGAVPLLSNPADPYVTGSGQGVINESGTLNPLKPQLSQDWNVGFDVSPPGVPGLKAHLTYYNINYVGQISAPPIGSGPFFGVASYSNLFIMHPTAAQVTAFLTARGVSPTAIANAQASQGGAPLYFVSDDRAQNLGQTKTYGLDFAAEYQHSAPFGAVFASFNGTYTLSSKDLLANLGNTARNASSFRSTTVVGAKIGDNLTGQLMWSHTAGFTLILPAALGQTSVGAFDTLDLYTQYDLKRRGLPPITLSLGVSNITDASPPHYNGLFVVYDAGYAGGPTTGRVVQLGAKVKF